MKLSLQCSQRAYLSQETKILLKQVLAQRLQLRHPEIPSAAKGLEGMLAADALLKERKAYGVLIGGLADAIWNQRRTKEELDAHHDTDVLVLDPYFTLQEKFEGGIDWWLPKQARLVIRDLGGNIEGEQEWWENGNGISLHYGIKNLFEKTAPGLYLPSRSDVIEMRIAEIMAGIDSNRVEIAEDFDEQLYRAIERKIGQRIASFIYTAFPQRVVGESSTEMFLTIDGHSIQTVTAIHAYQKKGKE